MDCFRRTTLLMSPISPVSAHSSVFDTTSGPESYDIGRPMQIL